jgi:hypothetical protein
VRNKEVCQIELLLEIQEQLCDLGLNRNVQCRYWLVSHDQLRVQRQRPRDTDTLALTAAELVRIPIHGRRIQPYSLQEVFNPGFPLAPEESSMDREGFANDGSYPHSRIQGPVGILKDELHFTPALSQFFGAQGEQGFAIEVDFS